MAWSVLQSKSAAASTSNVAATLGTACSSGSKLIAYVTVAQPALISGVSDGTNSFSQILAVNTSNQKTYIYVLDTPAGDVGATPTITATTSGTANGNAILVHEVSGLATGSTAVACLDGTAGTQTASNQSPGTITVPAYSSSVANEYLVAVWGDNGDTTGVPMTSTPSGFTADANNISNNGADDLSVVYKNSTGGAEGGGSWVTGGTHNYDEAQFIVAFLLGAGGSTAASPYTHFTPSQAWLARYRYKSKPRINPIPVASNVQYTQTLPANVVVSAATSSLTTRIISAVAVATGTMARTLTRSLTGVLTVLGKLSNQVQTHLSGQLTVYSTVTVIRQRIVSVAASLVAVASTQRTIGRILAGVITVTGALSRSTTRNVSSTVTLTSSTVRNVSRSVAAQVAVYVTVATQKFRIIVLAAQVTVNSLVSRTVNMRQAAQITVTAAVTRTVTRVFAAQTVVYAAFSAIKAKFVTLTAVVVINENVTRKIQPIISTAIIMVSGTTRTINRTIQGNFISAGQTARMMIRVITGTIVVTVAETATRVHIIVVSTIMSVSSKTTRVIQTVQTALMSVNSSVTRFIKTKFAAFMVVFVTVIPGRPFAVHLATTISVSSSTVARSIASAFVIVFKTGTAAFRWVAGKAKTGWKVGP